MISHLKTEAKITKVRMNLERGEITNNIVDVMFENALNPDSSMLVKACVLRS